MSRVQQQGRSLRMLPLEVDGGHISTIWSSNTLGSYMQSGGHVGICNRTPVNTDLYVWVGSIPTIEFDGSIGTHLSPSLEDIRDLNSGPVVNQENQQFLPQDPYGRYCVKKGLVLEPHSDGTVWTDAQIAYALAFIRKFGIRVPKDALYEPLIAPTSTLYIVSALNNQRQIGNIIT